MLGAHSEETVKPFDAVTLLTGHWKSSQEAPTNEQLDASWSARFAHSTPDCTQLPAVSIHDTWSPSMETPKTTSVTTGGISSLDSRMNKVSVTSPGMLFQSTPKHSLLSDEDDFCKSPVVIQPQPAMMGFTTGSGKKIKSPSKEAVERSNTLMMQLGFTTGSGKKIDPPKDENLLIADKLVNGERSVNESPKRKYEDFELIDGDDYVDFEEKAPVKSSRLHAELMVCGNEGELTWKEALRCAPCRDIEMASLSGIPMTVCTLTSDQAADFCFSSIGFPPWDVGSAYEDLSGLEGIKKDLMSFEWVQNHYRWIVWKASSLARCFPKLLSSFTPNETLRQLHERYLCEFVKCKRSALKLIAERDDVPGKPMVLMVARILGDNELELSDGWYSIKAIIDEPLSALVKKKRLREGFKLITSGATLSAGEPVPVLEAYESALRLSLCMNSTRRTRWHCKLGYQKRHFMVKSVRSDGGRIAGIEATIMKKYPQCYAIEDSLGNRQVYTQREYERLMDKYGSSPSPSQTALFKNSRTTSFIRILLNTNTLLTVWSPEMVMDMQEGDLIRLFGAVPSKHNTDGHLNINTTKGTVIVKIKSGTSTRQIYTELPEREKLPKELDFTCHVINTPEEANQRSMSLFVEDSNETQLCILVPKRHFDTFPRLKPNQAITFYDLLFMHYDRQKSLPVYTFTERSAFTIKR